MLYGSIITVLRYVLLIRVCWWRCMRIVSYEKRWFGMNVIIRLVVLGDIGKCLVQNTKFQHCHMPEPASWHDPSSIQWT
jgi:hypothetical protein